MPNLMEFFKKVKMLQLLRSIWLKKLGRLVKAKACVFYRNAKKILVTAVLKPLRTYQAVH